MSGEGATAMPKLHRPRAVLFDWDNTLIDSWGTIHLALTKTLETMGREPWSLEHTKTHVRQSLRDAFPAQFGDRWKEARSIYLGHYTAIHLDRLRALAGTEELVRELKDSGLYVAVVSNKTGAVLRREAEKLGWTEHFVRLVGAGDAHADKPHAAPMHMALADSGIELGDAVWYVGDTGIDMQCAANSRCVGVLLGELDATDQGLVAFPPTLHFRTCQALSTHIGGLTFPLA